jgi:UDP-4-keto-D-QuiNAc 4-reductase
MILVTGGTGFVGAALLKRLERDGVGPLRASIRATQQGLLQKQAPLPRTVEPVVVESLSENTAWQLALGNVRTVVHCAARAHVMREPEPFSHEIYRRVNCEGTLNLARQAARAGVKRFVFVSSVKVNGEASLIGRPCLADDPSLPEDAYGASKADAEHGLMQIAAQTGMAVTIVRPPLVIGAGARGNFPALMRWIALGRPLPFGAVTHNRRSFVALDNLVDLLCVSMVHPSASNQTFMVSDGEDVSTANLVQRIGMATGAPARLVSVPVGLMTAVARLVGKQAVAQRLLGTLQVDIGKARDMLGWVPPISIDEGLRRAAHASS